MDEDIPTYLSLLSCNVQRSTCYATVYVNPCMLYICTYMHRTERPVDYAMRLAWQAVIVGPSLRSIERQGRLGCCICIVYKQTDYCDGRVHAGTFTRGAIGDYWLFLTSSKQQILRKGWISQRAKRIFHGHLGSLRKCNQIRLTVRLHPVKLGFCTPSGICDIVGSETRAVSLSLG